MNYTVYLYSIQDYLSSIFGSMIKRVSLRVLKITNNAAITADAPKKSPTANLNTVITLIEFIELIIDKMRFTNNPFIKDETMITKYKNL